jgi:hypothetical protein
MPCAVCNATDHLVSKCPELSDEYKAPTTLPNKDVRHDDGGDEEERVLIVIKV